MTLSLTVPQANYVNVQRAHALQEEAEAERAASDFVGERLGLLVDTDGQQGPRQTFVGHVLEGKLSAQ